MLAGIGLFFMWGTSSAQGEAFSLQGPNGASYELLRIHGEVSRPVTSLLITRPDNSVTLMDVMLVCSERGYAYLAMDHTPSIPVSRQSLDQLAQYSEAILASNLNGLTVSPLSDEAYDAPMLALYNLVCS